jgi:hypothetical protein
MNPIAYFVGSARSGTTVLRRIVRAHPRIAVTNETHFVPRFYQRRTGMSCDGFVSRALLEALVAYHRFPRLGIGREELEGLLAADEPIHYSTFVSRLYDLFGRRQGKRLVSDKTGSYVRHIPTLHELWPSTRFVHLIRDGRDVTLSVLSWKEAPGASRSATWAEDRVSTTALWWKRNVQLGRAGGANLPPGLYHEIRYELLVSKPAEECEALCAFLKLPYHAAMLRFHEGRTRTDPGLSSKRAWLPITPGLRDWRSQMAGGDVERFEAIAGDLLEELGYERAYPSPSQEALERADRIRRAFVKEAHARGRPLPESLGGMNPSGNADVSQPPENTSMGSNAREKGRSHAQNT